MRQIVLLCCLLLSCFLEAKSSSFCYFVPPEGWEIADPKGDSTRVKMSFLKNTGKGFCPSINLAIEETQVTPSEYLKAVRAIHEQDRDRHWRTLGKVRTAAGLAQLTEIDTKTEWGPARILQLIHLKEGKAYILTAAALKEEFSSYYKEIQTAFRSLTLTNDLVGEIPQLERRDSLRTKEEQLTSDKGWDAFQDTILSQFGDMGAFWQVLVLREAKEKMLTQAPILGAPQ